MDSTTPRPDPTERTTEALLREISSLKELVETRLHAMDKAIELLQANADKSPTIAVVFEKVKSLQSVMDISLDCQREAVGKTEAGFTKQIDQQQLLLQQTAKSSDKEIGGLKERIDAMENRKAGFSEGWVVFVAAIGLILAIAAVAVAVLKG